MTVKLKANTQRIGIFHISHCGIPDFFNNFAAGYTEYKAVASIFGLFLFYLHTTDSRMRKSIATVLMAIVSAVSFAQSGTNSPYSQYGLGVLSDQTSAPYKGMNGLALGFHDHNQINYLNPASYAYLDSLTFIFDIGASGQITNYQEGGKKTNAKNANFEYAVAGFRLVKNLGLSFGVIPFTNTGYSYSTTERIGDSPNGLSSTSYSNTYSGSGGLHQAYIGLGWSPVKGLSVGANVSYLWGSYQRSIVNAYTDNYVNTVSKYYYADVSSYKLDLGVQYTTKLSKKDEVTLGVTYGLGHKLGADPRCVVAAVNKQTGVRDSTEFVANNALEIPATYGVGLAWSHNNKWRIGADYSLQTWSSVKYPVYTLSGDNAQYTTVSNMFADRHKITVGGEYCANERSRRFLKRIRYRLGASYTTPYLKINGQDGPKEYSVSAGFGIPIINTYNNRSILNISAQWVRQDSKMFITENSFRINIGLTFNERWFAKWKLE